MLPQLALQPMPVLTPQLTPPLPTLLHLPLTRLISQLIAATTHPAPSSVNSESRQLIPTELCARMMLWAQPAWPVQRPHGPACQPELLLAVETTGEYSLSMLAAPVCLHLLRVCVCVCVCACVCVQV